MLFVSDCHTAVQLQAGVPWQALLEGRHECQNGTAHSSTPNVAKQHASQQAHAAGALDATPGRCWRVQFCHLAPAKAFITHSGRAPQPVFARACV